jgi:hypothetical protein
MKSSGRKTGSDLMSATDVQQIVAYSLWSGFADPPLHAAKLTISLKEGRFVRERSLTGPSDDITSELVLQFLEALSRPPVPHLDPALFDIPESVVRSHFGSEWTDDHPEHLVRVTFSSGRVVTVRATSQKAFMLPLQVTDTATGTDYTTFDPRLSREIAALMPESYLEKERLGGRLWMLESDLEEFKRGGDQPTTPLVTTTRPDVGDADEVPAEEGSSEVLDDEFFFRILHRAESPEEKGEARRTGKLSERLLKRMPLEDVRELLAEGANPSVADDVGQTALMHAAWPPFDRERFRLLVKAGANLEARRNDGMAGLHLACAGGETTAVEEWLRAGANVDARTPEGATPLMLAATWPDIVRRLLVAGAGVNAADPDGHTALTYAIFGQSWLQPENQFESMQTLIGAGGDVNRRDVAGLTPLGHAQQVLGRVRLDEEVLRAFNPNVDLSFGSEWNPRRIAEAVVNLIASAGGRE